MSWLQFWSSIVASLAWPVCAVIIALLFRRKFADLLATILKLELPGGITAEFDRSLTRAEFTTAVVSSPGSMVSPAQADSRSIDSEEAAEASTVEVGSGVTPVAAGTDANRGCNSAVESPEVGHVQVENEGDLWRSARDSDTATADILRANEDLFDGRSSWIWKEAGLSPSLHQESTLHPTGVVMTAWKELESEVLRSCSIATPTTHVTATNLTPYLPMLVSWKLLKPDEAAAVQDLQRLRNLAAHSNAPLNPSEARRFVILARMLAAAIVRRRRSSDGR